MTLPAAQRHLGVAARSRCVARLFRERSAHVHTRNVRRNRTRDTWPPFLSRRVVERGRIVCVGGRECYFNESTSEYYLTSYYLNLYENEKR